MDPKIPSKMRSWGLARDGANSSSQKQQRVTACLEICLYIYQYITYIYHVCVYICVCVSGWWYTYPSEKWWTESQLGWWHSQLLGKIKFMFQTTNQFRASQLISTMYIYIYIYLYVYIYIWLSQIWIWIQIYSPDHRKNPLNIPINSNIHHWDFHGGIRQNIHPFPNS